MKGFTVILFYSLIAASCNTHNGYYQGILNDLEGSYSIDSVVYINNLGQDSVLTKAGSFYFNPCDADDNFSSKMCAGFYETAAGDRTDFKFQLTDDEKFTINPPEFPAGFNISVDVVSFEQNKEKLRLQFFKRENYAFYAEEQRPQLIVLTKQ